MPDAVSSAGYWPFVISQLVVFVAGLIAFFGAHGQMREARRQFSISNARSQVRDDQERLEQKRDHTKGLHFELSRYLRKLESRIDDLNEIIETENQTEVRSVDRENLQFWVFSEPASFSQTEITKSINDDEFLEAFNDFRQGIEEIEQTVNIYLKPEAKDVELKNIVNELETAHKEGKDLLGQIRVFEQAYSALVDASMTDLRRLGVD